MKDAPHQTIITVSYETYERLPNGQCTGIAVDRNSHLYTKRGNNFEECNEELIKFLQEKGLDKLIKESDDDKKE